VANRRPNGPGVTARPTAEALLQAFKGVYLSVVTLGEQVWVHVMALSDARKNILALLDFTVEVNS